MDQEMKDILTAYNALKGMTRAEWNRALEYIGARLAGDDRTAYITAGEGFPEPVQYVIEGDLGTATWSPEEAVLESDTRPYEIVEVNGAAVVSQSWAVIVAADGDDTAIEWFGTRDEAEAFVAGAFASC